MPARGAWFRAERCRTICLTIHSAIRLLVVRFQASKRIGRPGAHLILHALHPAARRSQPVLLTTRAHIQTTPIASSSSYSPKLLPIPAQLLPTHPTNPIASPARLPSRADSSSSSSTRRSASAVRSAAVAAGGWDGEIWWSSVDIVRGRMSRSRRGCGGCSGVSGRRERGGVCGQVDEPAMP